MKKCLVISNPISGNYNSKNYIYEIENVMNKYDYCCRIIPTQYKNHAYYLAKDISDDFDLILSDGGDGTLHEAISGNLARKNPILHAHIPSGTTNDVGHMYGYEKNPINSLQQVLNGQVKNVDYFGINNNPFVYVAGMGQFLHIPYTTSKEAKNRFGHLAYIYDGVKAWQQGTKMYDISYEIDGKTYNDEASIVLVTNSTRVAGFNGVYKDGLVKLDDGLMEVVIVKQNKNLKLFKDAMQLLMQDVTCVKDVDIYQTDNFKVTFNEPLIHNPCVDGEEYKSEVPTYEFNKIKQLKMLLPNNNIEKLFK